MDKKLTRKSFISQLGIHLASALSLPIAGAQSFSNNDNNKEIMENNSVHPISGIQAMGFQWETADPFLFCVHHEDKFPKGNDQMGPAVSLKGRSLGDDFIIKDGFRMYHGKQVPGFPGHPHRGFETVTVVREGIVDHADSLGAAGRYGHGDVQWMTAGRGVQHSEMFPCVYKDKENPLELFQIWLNLPAKNKMTEPHFKMLWAESIPRYKHKNSAGKQTEVEIIAGKIGKNIAPTPPPGSWAADPANEVAIWNIRMEPGASWELPPTTQKGINRKLYYYIGEHLVIDGKAIPRYHSMSAKSDQPLKLINGATEAKILMLQGRPIGEPVIQYGPFVMNTKAEIQQAFEDYHRTQFGGWPWPKTAQVHDRTLGRFARHANGKEEFRS